MAEVLFEINTEEGDARKERRITLHKEPMENEINAATYKFVDASDMASPKQGNAISSDTEEMLDGSIIAQLMEYRDAKLRNILESYMAEETVEEVDNYLHNEPLFRYNLSLPEDFNDALLRPLATLMHKYIVWGCLFDWYAKLGITSEARVYGDQLEGVEDEIESAVSPAGYARRPLQPFGPANKIY